MKARLKLPYNKNSRENFLVATKIALKKKIITWKSLSLIFQFDKADITRVNTSQAPRVKSSKCFCQQEADRNRTLPVVLC